MEGSSAGFSFAEISSTRASTGKLVCCDLSSDGKLLATGGHDKKVGLWYPNTMERKSTLEGHNFLITDVRFNPSITRLATSSFDKTVRLWDADNPGYYLHTFAGHSAAIMSLDFHPNEDDIICSCDGDGEMRYWSIKSGSCVRVFKGGGTTQIRFQPRLGRYLAAAAGNIVSILDVETLACLHQLQTLELWDMLANRIMTLSAHEGLIAALAASNVNGLVASASHDKFVKLWK